jgi:outer membrane protein TolC
MRLLRILLPAVFGLIPVCIMAQAAAPAPQPPPAAPPAAGGAQNPAQPPGGQQPSSLQTPLPGQVPPRNPRLAPLNTQESTVPPALTFPKPPPAAGVPQRPLTADEAAQIALHFQPNILTAKAALLAQKARTKQTASLLGPQLNGGLGYTRVWTLSGPTVVNTGRAFNAIGLLPGSTGSPIDVSKAAMPIGSGGSSTGSASTVLTGPTGTSTSGPATGSVTTSSLSGTVIVSGGSGSTGPAGSTTGATRAGSSSSSTSTPASSTPSSSASVGAPISQGTLAELTVSQLIFDFNRTRDLVSQSKALERAFRQDLNTQIYTDVFLVKQAFYQYVLNLNIVTVNEQEVANRQTELDTATAQYNVGIGQPGDVYTAQTAKAEAIQNLIVARTVAEEARINLALLMGIDPNTPITPALSSEPHIEDAGILALTTQALQQRPELLAAQATVQAYKYALSSAQKGNLPSVQADGEILSSSDQFFPQNDYAAVGVSLSWDLFDYGLTRGRVQEQSANVSSAQSQLASELLQVRSDVASAFVNVQNAKLRIDSAQADVANAEQSVNTALARYRTGVGEFQAILTAQDFLFTSRTNLTNALGVIPQFQAQLEYAVGTPARGAAALTAAKRP